MVIPGQASQSLLGKSTPDHCYNPKGIQVEVLGEQPIPVHFSYRGRRKTTRLKDEEDLPPAKKPVREYSKQRTWQTIPRFQRAHKCSLDAEEQQKSPTLERPKVAEAPRWERYPSVVRMTTQASQSMKKEGQQSTLTEMEIPEVVMLDIEGGGWGCRAGSPSGSISLVTLNIKNMKTNMTYLQILAKTHPII